MSERKTAAAPLEVIWDDGTHNAREFEGAVEFRLGTDEMFWVDDVAALRDGLNRFLGEDPAARIAELEEKESLALMKAKIRAGRAEAKVAELEGRKCETCRWVRSVAKLSMPPIEYQTCGKGVRTRDADGALPPGFYCSEWEALEVRGGGMSGLLVCDNPVSPADQMRRLKADGCAEWRAKG